MYGNINIYTYQRIKIYNHFLMKQSNRFGRYNYENVNTGLTQSARANFVSKVYSILSIQLAITASVVFLNIYSQTFAYIQATYNSLWWLAFIGALCTLLPLCYSSKVSQTFPTNMCLLGVFTLCESYLVSSITAFYTAESVLMSAVATAAATFGITFYAWTSKSDFTSYLHSFYALASSAFWIFLFLSLFNVFIFRSSFITNVIAFAIACIYCIYILIDTQLIMGGKNRQLTLDNYVMGAMILYVDIIGLFLKILQLLGEKKKK